MLGNGCGGTLVHTRVSARIIEPPVRGVPESGLIRCWFLKKNKIVGQPSSLPRVTIFGS